MKIKKTMSNLIIFFGVTYLLIGCNNEQMEVKSNTITIEYGEQISSDVCTYLNNTEDYCKDVEITGIPDNEEDKDYPKVGSYILNIVRKKEDTNITVEVKDTVKPEFTDIKDKYEVEYGKEFNKKLIKAKDLSNVKIIVDDENVDYKKVGDYKVNVKAEDEHGNISEKVITILVKEEVKKDENEKTFDNGLGSSGNNGSSSKPQNSTNSSSSSNKTQSSSSNKTNAGTSDKKPSSSTGSSSSNSNVQSSSSNKTETGTSDKKPSGSTGSSSSSSSSNKTESSSKPTSHKHEGPAVENMYFDTWDELDEWAEAYQDHKLFEEGVDIGAAYGASECSCGKKYIHRFY